MCQILRYLSVAVLLAVLIAGCARRPPLPVPAAHLPRINFPVADLSKPAARLKLNQPIPAEMEVAFVVPIKGANEMLERIPVVSFNIGHQRSDGFHELKGGFLYLTGKEGDALVLSRAVGPVTPRWKEPVVIIIKSCEFEKSRTLVEYEAEFQ